MIMVTMLKPLAQMGNSSITKLGCTIEEFVKATFVVTTFLSLIHSTSDCELENLQCYVLHEEDTDDLKL